MVRALRRARRSLGGWRDCHVVIALLERKLRNVRNSDQKEAWAMVLASARDKLHREMRRARRKIANRKMFTLAQRGQELIEHGSPHAAQPDTDPLIVLGSSVIGAYTNWRKALATAVASDDPAKIHAFRIQTKRLRYRIELMRDLGSATAKAALGSLRQLQDELGRWHDNIAFTRITAEALADPDFLVQNPVTAAAILRKLDRDDARYLKRVRDLLATMYENADASPLHAAMTEFEKSTAQKDEFSAPDEPAPSATAAPN